MYIAPIIVGQLNYGTEGVFSGQIYFAEGYHKDTSKGMAFAVMCGPWLKQITKANGEPLIYEGFAGLTCHYNETTGVIGDFYEE